MGLKKIQLHWNAPTPGETSWRLGLYRLSPIMDAARTPPGRSMPSYWKNYVHHALHIRVRGLVAWALALLVLGYFAGALLVLKTLESKNPYNRVAYADLVLPTRWAEVSRLRGAGMSAQGRALLAKGEFASGFVLLRLGLARDPGDFAARLDVAKIHLALRLRSQAEALLREGFAYGYPGRDYLRFALAMAEEGGRPATWVEFCERADAALADLPSDARPSGDAAWIEHQSMRALIAAGREDQALALLKARRPENDPLLREVSVLHRLGTGRPDEARALAAAWARDEPLAPEPLRLLARAARESGDAAAMDEALLRLRGLAPDKPDALLFALAQHHLAGRAEAAEKALDDLLFRHGANAALYPTLATVLVRQGDDRSIERLARALDEQGISRMPLERALLAEAVERGRWTEAARHAAEIRRAGPAGSTSAQDKYLAMMERLAAACIDPSGGAQSSLVQQLADQPGTLRLYLVVLRALIDADRAPTARQVLTLADGFFPTADALARVREELAAKMIASAPAEETAGQARTPTWPTFAAFEAEFETLGRAGDRPAQLARLTQVRRQNPDWLANERPRLDAWELPLRAREDDPLLLQFFVRGALARDEQAPGQLLDLARLLHREGRVNNAVLIVKELLRHAPTSPEALSQLAEWAPPRDGRPVDAP